MSFSLTNPEQINMARVLAVRAALRLEIRTGMKRSSRGASTMTLAKEITGSTKGRKLDVYGDLDAFIVDKLGPSFARPLA